VKNDGIYLGTREKHSDLGEEELDGSEEGCRRKRSMINSV